ncbi:hypothetical protein Atai01_56870 [Amycolatopsis taiwanensis]|uniref:Uncharacterized protein n=1 Tax=Amycolatopsis taiwanensis TaxID=342230 RepID=A0A9W6VF14_9PSEU|nr:hypothetical protein Atai01_56870 [Amycolatopsis taiwanensis]
MQFHFIPKRASRVNWIETRFGIITRQSIRRGTFSSVKVLIKQVRDYIAHWNTNPTRQGPALRVPARRLPQVQKTSRHSTVIHASSYNLTPAVRLAPTFSPTLGSFTG